MRRKIHRQLMRLQRFVGVVVLLGIGLFVLWARSRQFPLPVIIGSSSALIIGALLVGGYYYKWAWTGLTDSAYPKFDGVEFHRGKTLWDWLQLLIIPGVLAFGGYIYQGVEKQNEQIRTEQQAQTEQEIADDRIREEALQDYLDRMSELLIEKGLRESESDDEVQSVARARTLTTIQRLDKDRKGLLLQFLQESQLIQTDHTIVNLVGADMRNTVLFNASLERANLQGARLQGAHFLDVNFSGANLQGARLWGIMLSWANLQSANFTEAQCYGASLRGSDFRGANLTRAIFWDADLERANLEGAILEGAILEGASLKDAIVTPEQLAQAASLTGAIMPDGSIHP